MKGAFQEEEEHSPSVDCIVHLGGGDFAPVERMAMEPPDVGWKEVGSLLVEILETRPSQDWRLDWEWEGAVSPLLSFLLLPCMTW